MIYFSSKNIKALAPYSPQERVSIIQEASRQMPFARRAVAGTLKLLILAALFWALLFVPGIIWKVVSLLAAGLLYPLLLLPVTVSMTAPYIEEELARRKQNEQIAKHEPSEAPDGSLDQE